MPQSDKDNLLIGPKLLKDGRQALDAGCLFARLDALGIVHHTVSHSPVFTVAQAQALRGELRGAHSKNLFLRNKKGRMWLLTCDEGLTVDLRQVAEWLDAKRLSFGSPERLMSYLGVIPGAVTPFAVINDDGFAVQMVLDVSLIDQILLNFHPLDNAMTTQISSRDLLLFLASVGHRPIVVDFERGILTNQSIEASSE